MSLPGTVSRYANGKANKVHPRDQAVHNWYRFVLSFPPHLVEDYLARFGVGAKQRVLDPFCGTGTTLVACKQLGIPSVGIEANPLAHFASQVKTNWEVDPEGLAEHAARIAEEVTARLEAQGLGDFFQPGRGAPRAGVQLLELPPESHRLLLSGSISPVPLHKTLTLLAAIRSQCSDGYRDCELLALAKLLPTTVGNLHFGPEVGVGATKTDAPVVEAWLGAVRQIASDLRLLRGRRQTPSLVHCADARRLEELLSPASVDAVITSPPYPNEKDYTRTTRLESVVLGFLANRADLRALKHGLLRSNTRGVYKTDDDDRWIADHPEIERLAREIEARRIELGKTSGFERLYARVTRLYFGGMKRHFADLRGRLRPGAHLAYVVGDQASYLRVMIRTGQLLAEIAESLGYEVVGIDLFRTRLATATRERLREEVVVLRWPGKVGATHWVALGESTTCPYV
jgi:SAM-dependent methyltransferase